MNKIKQFFNQAPIGFWLFMGFTIGLFFYLGGCGVMNIQPFTHKPNKPQFNSSCGDNLQIMGYCCNSQEQYNTGDCTK